MQQHYSNLVYNSYKYSERESTFMVRLSKLGVQVYSEVRVLVTYFKLNKILLYSICAQHKYKSKKNKIIIKIKNSFVCHIVDITLPFQCFNHSDCMLNSLKNHFYFNLYLLGFGMYINDILIVYNSPTDLSL